jgi:hypothetical protein
MQASELVEQGGIQTRRFSGLERPPLNSESKTTINDSHKRNAAGQFVDPKTGKAILKPQYGHKEGYENWRILKQAERLGLKQDQLDDFINAHPHYFEIQEKAFNESHIGELLGPDPIADSRILRDMERFFGL